MEVRAVHEQDCERPDEDVGKGCDYREDAVVADGARCRRGLLVAVFAVGCERAHAELERQRELDDEWRGRPRRRTGRPP